MTHYFASAQVLLMAEARRKTEQQKQEMQEQELSNKMEQTKALLNEQAKMMLQDKQRQKQLLVVSRSLFMLATFLA